MKFLILTAVVVIAISITSAKDLRRRATDENGDDFAIENAIEKSEIQVPRSGKHEPAFSGGNQPTGFGASQGGSQGGSFGASQGGSFGTPQGGSFGAPQGSSFGSFSNEPHGASHGSHAPGPGSVPRSGPPLPNVNSLGHTIKSQVAGAGSFLAKAAEVIDDLSLFAQISGQEVTEASQAKQELFKEKSQAANTALGIGQEFGQVALPIISSLFGSLKTMIKYKTSLLRSFNELRNRPKFKPEEDDLDLALLLGR